MSKQVETYLQHAGLADFDTKGTAPVAMPTTRSSTVRFQSMAHLDQAFNERGQGQKALVYGRGGMQNHRALEDIICQLEAGTDCYLASSGMAAITLAILSVVNHGDHIIVTDGAYAPVRTLDQQFLQRMGISVSYCEPTVESCQAALQDNTKVLYMESPSSLLMQMIDVPALASFAASKQLVSIADNTWGSGLIYQPLALGVDISVIAATKYIGGHSDLLMGAVVCKETALAQKINHCQYALGYSVSADDVWLALRGVRTMPIRMRACAENALAISERLATWEQVKQVYHPAWPGDATHELWRRDATGSNGMLAFSLKATEAQCRRFVDALQLFGIGFSWGGFESLVQLVPAAAIAPHSYWQEDTVATVLRLHAGLEAIEDLLADLEQARQQALLSA